MDEETTISALPAIGAVHAGTVFPADDSGETYKVSAAQLQVFLASYFATVAQGALAASAVQPAALAAAVATLGAAISALQGPQTFITLVDSNGQNWKVSIDANGNLQQIAQ
jgi:hypothetical protein